MIGSVVRHNSIQPSIEMALLSIGRNIRADLYWPDQLLFILFRSQGDASPAEEPVQVVLSILTTGDLLVCPCLCCLCTVRAQLSNFHSQTIHVGLR